MIKYQHVIALDNDKAGINAMKKIGGLIPMGSFKGKIKYVKPPTKYKDWNEMLIKLGPNVLNRYLQEYEEEFDPLIIELQEI